MKAPTWPRLETEWPTVFLFFVSIAIFALSTFAGMQFETASWQQFPFLIINALCVYALFTIIHEASHRNISRRFPQMEFGLGVIATMFFHGSFEQFILIHLQHHNKVNIEGEDPDLHAQGPITLKRVLIWTSSVVVYMYNYFRLGLYKRTKSKTVFLPYVFLLGLYIYLTSKGYGWSLIIFYTLPSLLGITLTIYVFDHLPHVPHRDPGKYTNARNYPMKGRDWLFFMHSYHLIHHLWPSIPWYRYRECYQAKRQELLAAGAKEVSRIH